MKHTIITKAIRQISPPKHKDKLHFWGTTMNTKALIIYYMLIKNLVEEKDHNHKKVGDKAMQLCCLIYTS